MGGKIKSVVLLVLILIMIYYQYSPVSYAGDMRNTWQTRKWAFGESNNEMVRNEKDSGDRSGADKKEDEEDKGGIDNGDEEDKGEDKVDEDDKNNGENTGGGDDGDDNKEDGDDKKGDEDNDGGNEKDEENEKDEGDKKEENGDGESGGEDEEPVRKYELKLPMADGENGYYITAPEIEIRHVSSKGKTVYSLKNGKKVRIKGELKKENECVILSGESLGEGKNILSLYMEDEKGARLEEFNLIKDILLDTQRPSVEVNSSNGFDVWYQKEAQVFVSADDGTAGSQIDSITCYCGGELVGLVRDKEGSFMINTASERSEGADVLIVVDDKAGNVRERKYKLYIDNAPPGISVEGTADYMITSKAVELAFHISDDNGLKSCSAEIGWENPDGERLILSGLEWTGEIYAKEASLSLEKEGIYYMRIKAEDLSGYAEEKELQFIIDRRSPVIRYVDMLEGKYLKKFQWDYQKEAFIQDFTTYDYQIELDGKLYPIGKEIREEGRHMLRVQAEDSAGNKAEAKASFVVDHTAPEIVFSELEDGAVYEEERTFQISAKGTEDELREVRINGAFQPLAQGSRTRQYKLQEPGDYEVTARAYDKAGNETISSIWFKITEKETILQKAIKPIKRIFSGETEEYMEKGQVKEDAGSYEERKNELLMTEVLCAVCIASCAAGIVWYRKRKS